MLEIRENPSPISLHHSCLVVSHPLITDTRSSSSCFPFQIKLLAKGNQRDESDFTERENTELNQFNDGLRMKTDRISMAPPVNRQNELASRANYYQTFARENFDGHWNLLGAHGFHIGDEGNMRHGLGYLTKQQPNLESDSTQQLEQDAAYMWREEQIEQFVYLMRSGEEKRRWILKDYEFEDPFNVAKVSSWSQELENRLQNFEAQSNSLVKEMYRRKGWAHSSDYKHLGDGNEKDDFFDDSD